MRLDIGLMTFDLPAVAAYARRAEAMGFGAIWSAETRHDPFLPLAVAATKRSMRLGLDASFDANMYHVTAELMQLLRTRDFREGLQAFLEKREPHYEGR